MTEKIEKRLFGGKRIYNVNKSGESRIMLNTDGVDYGIFLDDGTNKSYFFPHTLLITENGKPNIMLAGSTGKNPASILLYNNSEKSVVQAGMIDNDGFIVLKDRYGEIAWSMNASTGSNR